MPHFHIPADVRLEPLVRQMRALGLEPGDTCADGALVFVWRRPRLGEGGACAHSGCNRTGTVRWSDDDATYCADHAYSQRRDTQNSLRIQLDTLADMERVCREQLAHYRRNGQAGLAAEAELDLSDIHDRQAQIQAQLDRAAQVGAA